MTTHDKSRRFAMGWAALIVFGIVLQFAALRNNPPGFFIDESSIAFNAHTIATTGRDEHGEPWPLFFRAFGEFKNPVYIYLLAGIFRLGGPSILAARGLSASCGLLTVLLLGLLGARIAQSQSVGLMLAIMTLLTPWLFELSRLAMEVAIYPLTVVLFLLAVWHAAHKPKWKLTQICALAITLALLTYSYSIGRLLAPLLGLGLLIFMTRARLLSIVLTWITYFVTLIPLLIFNQRHPSALTGRFRFVSYLTPDSSWFEATREFFKHFFLNLNPWRLFVTESSKVSEIVHIPGPPAMLTVTAVLIIASLFFLIRHREVNSWWCFVGYGLLVSVVPASLTTDDFHMLRLAPVPVFLLILTLPALRWLTNNELPRKRVALILIVLLIGSQGLLSQWRYHSSVSSPRRLHTFDADYPAKILPTALATAGLQPVYLADNSARPAYIQALWYGTLLGIPLNKFISLGFDKSAPEGAVVITTEQICPRCRVLVESEPYTTYIAQGPPRVLARLPDEAMSSELTVLDPPLRLHPGQQVTLSVSVKNVSKLLWPAGDRSGSLYRVSVGNHWLYGSGNVRVSDDGRTSLTTDLHPNQTMLVPLTINAPRRTGEYLLEVDLLQENVSWFGLKGSHTWRGAVRVTD